MIKKNFVVALNLAGIVMLAFFFSCGPGKEKIKDPVLFSGYVYDITDPVPKAEIQLGKFKAWTDERGFFTLKAEKASRYVLNIRKNGYGLTSRILFRPLVDETYYLHRGTTDEFDPNKDIELEDKGSGKRIGSPSSRAAWKEGKINELPLVYKDGKLVDFGFPKEMQEVFDYVRNRKEAGKGASIFIPAKSLIGKLSKRPPAGKIKVSISTIDLFSPDAMPGDFTVSNPDGTQETGFMISFGAASINAWDKEDEYSLDPKAKAKIKIPLDPGQLLQPDSIEKSIPLFWYNEETGYWVKDGEAFLTDDRTAYVGEVGHFSSFNMDIEKTTPACLKIRQTASTPLNSFKVEVIAKKGTNIIQRVKSIAEGGDCLVKATGSGLHQLYNLPQLQQMCIIVYDNANNPLSISIPTTGATYKPGPLPSCTSPTCPGACPDESLCDSDSACNGYIGCSMVPIISIPENLLLAYEKGATVNTVTLRWVYKNHVSGTTTYTIHRTDAATGCSDDASPFAPVVTERTITGGFKVLEAVITVTPGTYQFKVKASDGTESNCFSAASITW